MRKLQQGDVIIRKIKGVPNGAKRVSRTMKGFVLADGEATGHSHVIDDDIEMYEKDGALFIKTSKSVIVRHEEHKPITLSRGIYVVGRVRECDLLEEALSRNPIVRNVRD